MDTNTVPAAWEKCLAIATARLDNTDKAMADQSFTSAALDFLDEYNELP